MIVGYGFRYGPTTRIESVHHVIGGSQNVAIPPNVAHALWDHYGRDERNEVILFHNHPQSLRSRLLALPLPSRADRLVLEARALQPPQILRPLLGKGRVMFFLEPEGRKTVALEKSLAPAGAWFCQTETTAFSRGYVLTPLRGSFRLIRNSSSSGGVPFHR